MGDVVNQSFDVFINWGVLSGGAIDKTYCIELYIELTCPVEYRNVIVTVLRGMYFVLATETKYKQQLHKLNDWRNNMNKMRRIISKEKK